MFSFRCAHCGHKEIAHTDDMEHCLESGLWPDEEYQEEADTDAIEETDKGDKRKRGYKNSLKTCPGFDYRKADRTDVIQAFASNKYYLEYAPSDWRDAAQALAEKVSQFKPQR